MPLSEKEDISQELAHITVAEEAKQKKASVAGPSVAARARANAAQRARPSAAGSNVYIKRRPLSIPVSPASNHSLLRPVRRGGYVLI